MSNKHHLEHGDHTHEIDDYGDDMARAELYADICSGDTKGFILLISESGDESESYTAMTMQNSGMDKTAIIGSLEVAKARMVDMMNREEKLEDSEYGN